MTGRKFLSLIAGLLLFSGIPFVGWGLNDAGGFLSNPFRLAFVTMMAVLSVLVILFVPEEGKGQGEGIKPVKRQKISLRILQILPLFMILSSPCCDRQKFCLFPENSVLRLIGLMLVLFGFLLMNWSIIILGKQFSIDVTVQENHRLITNGPYKYIRHPRYAGIILFLTGIPLIFLSWISLLPVLLLLLVIHWRIADEEELMHREFKEDWENYKKKTHSLIPFIY